MDVKGCLMGFLLPMPHKGGADHTGGPTGWARPTLRPWGAPQHPWGTALPREAPHTSPPCWLKYLGAAMLQVCPR